jgi:K+/H+ antiporter YhaU regulatory subunit KhtT
MKNQPLSERLKEHFRKVTSELRNLLKEIKVKFVDFTMPNIAIVRPDYYWNQCTPQQESIRIRIKRDYERFYEMLNLLLRQAPNDVTSRFSEADKRFRDYIELESNWSLTESMTENLKHFDEAAEDVASILSIFNHEQNRETLLIPDTNSLLINADPVTYRGVTKIDKFTFLLLPTVLGELDKLKFNHRNPDVRDKAEKVIKRIKGWRGQGSLTDGVTVDKTIVVRALYKEPDMENTLSWLDSSVQDDRIIANVLYVQAENTSSVVHLVTGDINLQNKADVAFISILEID